METFCLSTSALRIGNGIFHAHFTRFEKQSALVSCLCVREPPALKANGFMFQFNLPAKMNKKGIIVMPSVGSVHTHADVLRYPAILNWCLLFSR